MLILPQRPSLSYRRWKIGESKTRGGDAFRRTAESAAFCSRMAYAPSSVFICNSRSPGLSPAASSVAAQAKKAAVGRNIKIALISGRLRVHTPF